MKSDADLYTLLGVDRDATVDEIRSAFRAAARANHPDRFVTYVQRIRATARMQDLNHAYSLLKDPERRGAYDARRQAMRSIEGARATPGDRTKRTSRAGISVRLAVFVAIGWLVASSVFAYFYGPPTPARSAADYVQVVLAALVVPPLLVLVAAFAVGIPSLIVARFFGKSFAERRAVTPTSDLRLVWDFGVRVFGLTVAGLLFARGIQLGLPGELVSLMLLAVVASFAGELVAMLLYVARLRRVVSKTDALLRVDRIESP